MKLAIALGAFSIGTRPLDFTNIWSNPRGLTGTDLCFVRTMQEMQRLGHEVHGFTVQSSNVADWNGITLHDASALSTIDESFDAVVSLNEPNLMIGLPRKPVKIVWQMLNDFSFVQPGFDDAVDHYFGVCDEHTRYVAAQCPRPEKWSTLSLGCDPHLYQDGKQVAGRVVWCSSADRGLHWLLQQWPTIKRAVPHASLRVLYHFNYDHVMHVDHTSVSPQGGPYHHHIQEMAQRVRYIKHAMQELAPLGVEHIGSVSRERMVDEWSLASVHAFACDTVAFSEGFSVSTLEAHASYTIPIITSADCLGSIYKDSGSIMYDAPISQHLLYYTDEVIRQLQQPDRSVIERCREFANAHTWSESAKRLEGYIKETKCR